MAGTAHRAIGTAATASAGRFAFQLISYHTGYNSRNYADKRRTYYYRCDIL